MQSAPGSSFVRPLTPTNDGPGSRGPSSTKPSAQQHLHDDEEWLWSVQGIGLYAGNIRMPDQQTMTAHLTTHRLLFLPYSSSAAAEGRQIQLQDVRQTEHYLGFVNSSPKVTLYLGAANSIDGPSDGAVAEGSSWTCHVCGYSNPNVPGSSAFGAAPAKCKLCGIARQVLRLETPLRPASAPPIPAQTAAPSSTTAPTTTTTTTTTERACPRCTFLNHPSLSRCEICEAPLADTIESTAATSSPTLNSATGRAQTPTPRTGGGGAGSSLWLGMNTLTGSSSSTDTDSMEILRLSFRKQGDKEFYRRLKLVLSQKAWQKGHRHGAKVDNGAGTGGRGGAGIDGIMQNMGLESRKAESNVQEAFQDMEALMLRAGEMVNLVKQLNSKLSAHGDAGVGEEDQTFVRSALVQMGLPAPAITKDQMDDEQEYLRGLAEELGMLLTGSKGRPGLMVGGDGRGLVGSDEVWGLWNRARGISLVSPKVMKDVLRYLPEYTRPPVRSLRLPSGSVLHTPIYAPPALAHRLRAQLTPAEQADGEPSLTTLDIAMQEGLTVSVCKEILDVIALQVGTLVIDEQGNQGGGDRWFRNIILDQPLAVWSSTS